MVTETFMSKLTIYELRNLKSKLQRIETYLDDQAHYHSRRRDIANEEAYGGAAAFVHAGIVRLERKLDGDGDYTNKRTGAAPPLTATKVSSSSGVSKPRRKSSVKSR